MTTDEEYLDNLLKSMEENPNNANSDRMNLNDINLNDVGLDDVSLDDINLDDISLDDANLNDIRLDDMHLEEPGSDDVNLDDIISDDIISDDIISDEITSDEAVNDSENTAASDSGIHEAESAEDDDWNSSLDELLSAADGAGPEQADRYDESDSADVTQIIDGMKGFDEDLDEISELLKKSDNNELINDTVVMGENEQDDIQALLDNIEEPVSETKEKKGKNKKKNRFSKKRKKLKTDKEINPEEAAEENQNEWDAISPEGEDVNNANQDILSGEAKKTGFFKRAFDYLLREEEEPEAGNSGDENSEILKELETEDKADTKKKKKNDKKKKDKKKKEKSNAAEPENDDENVEEAKNKKGKKQKNKKEKIKPEKVKPEKVKGDRILSTKALAVLIAFCATIIAAIVSLSSFLPDYSDKKNAREAFYTGDYKEVYQLLYDKNLNESDALLFNRAGIVLQLQSKLDAYDFYKKSGNEAEALDELLQGVIRYTELTGGDTYGASEELYYIYQTILTHLIQDYGISEEEAFEINTYDDNTYSKKIYSVVNGTEFVKPGEENGKQNEPEEPQDVLPEEEDIIQMEIVSEGA